MFSIPTLICVMCKDSSNKTFSSTFDQYVNNPQICTHALPLHRSRGANVKQMWHLPPLLWVMTCKLHGVENLRFHDK